MYEYLVILLVGLLGLSGAGWWTILIGAVALSLDPLLQQWIMLRGRPLVPFDKQIAAYFAVTLGTSTIACSGVYLIGALGHIALVGK